MLAALTAFGAKSSPADEGEASVGDRATCELKIKGERIERLKLESRKGEAQEFHRPGAAVFLPEGEYQVQEVALESGAVYSYWVGSYGRWFSVSPDRLNEIKVGAPIFSRLEVERSGRIVRLDHGLVDAGGRRFSARGLHGNPPTFTVYRGDREVGSGTFEYG